MRAAFRIAADLEVVIEKGPEGAIYFRISRGVDYGEPQGQPAREETRTDWLAFSKAEARAVASALMGCAAEV